METNCSNVSEGEKSGTSVAERATMICAIIAFVISECLPFLEKFFGCEVNGNGIFHLIHGLITSDCKEVEQAIDAMEVEVTND